MKYGMLVVLLLAILVGCGEATEPAQVPEQATENQTEAQTEALAAELRVFFWGEYLPEEVETAFEAEFGTNLIVDTYSSNEEMAAKVRAGNSGYDIVQPSDYMVALLADAGYLVEINQANIPNLSQIDPANLGLYYDPENTYSVPYLWGTTGIAYDETMVQPAPESWGVLFDPARLAEYDNRSSMLNDEREAIGVALLYTGYDVNDSSPEALEAAKAALLGQKPLLGKYNSDNVYQDLASGEIVLAQAWSGDAGLAMTDNPNIRFMIPQEGGVIWQDNLAILKESPNQATAEAFINFLLRPEISAQIADYTGYLTPNTAAVPLVSDETKAIYAVIAPDAATRERLEWLRRGENATAFSDLWADVKSQ